MNRQLKIRCLNCTKVFEVSFDAPTTLICSQCGSINLEFEKAVYATCKNGHRSYKVIKNFSREPICERCEKNDRNLVRTLAFAGKELEFAEKYATKIQEDPEPAIEPSLPETPPEESAEFTDKENPPLSVEPEKEKTSGPIDKITKPKKISGKKVLSERKKRKTRS